MARGAWQDGPSDTRGGRRDGRDDDEGDDSARRARRPASSRPRRPWAGSTGRASRARAPRGLTFERRWTRPGVHPYDEITWEYRTAGDPARPARASSSRRTSRSPTSGASSRPTSSSASTSAATSARRSARQRQAAHRPRRQHDRRVGAHAALLRADRVDHAIDELLDAVVARSSMQCGHGNCLLKRSVAS